MILLGLGEYMKVGVSSRMLESVTAEAGNAGAWFWHVHGQATGKHVGVVMHADLKGREVICRNCVMERCVCFQESSGAGERLQCPGGDCKGAESSWQHSRSRGCVAQNC